MTIEITEIEWDVENRPDLPSEIYWDCDELPVEPEEMNNFIDNELFTQFGFHASFVWTET